MQADPRDQTPGEADEAHPTPVGAWVLEHASDPKFPFRLRIDTRGRAEPLLSFFVQDRWPGSNQHIFCLRESRLAEEVVVSGEVERVPVVALQRCGRRLSVVLGRPRQKRCAVQIVDKTDKHPEPGGRGPPCRRARPGLAPAMRSPRALGEGGGAVVLGW